MVIVKIVDDGGKECWGMVELQGDLMSRNNSDMSGQFVGDLHFSGNVPVLIVGHHILHGKVVDLEKPLALLEPTNSTDEAKSMNLDLRAVISKKIIFKTRPKPIVVSPESLKSKQEII